MFIHMVHIKNVAYTVRSAEYEISVYKVQETGEHRAYIAKDRFGVGDIFSVPEDVIQDAKQLSGTDLVEELIRIAKDDIERNPYQLY